jgi:hypothetical protein
MEDAPQPLLPSPSSPPQPFWRSSSEKARPSETAPPSASSPSSARAASLLDT